MDEKIIIDKLFAMEEFSRDLRNFIQELLEAKEEVSPEEAKPLTAEIKEVPEVEEDTEEVNETEEEETEDDVMTVEDVINEYGLMDIDVAELKELLDSYEIKYDKRKKDKKYLAELIAENVIKGIIPVSEEETTEEDAEDEEIENEETEEVEIPQVRIEKEEEIEKGIRNKFESGKLKPSAIKAYLNKYYDGDPDCADCKGCSQEEMLDCYIDIHKFLVDDEGTYNELSNPYVRDGENFCCGKPLAEHPDEENVLVCKVCGEMYEV